MATYYVRKTGNDGAAGTSAGTAWLTIDKAASTATSAGDIVYVGAGTYRETVTCDASGSSGSPIQFIADVDGEQTGDAGLVVISAFTDSDTVTRTRCWDPNGQTFVTVRGFVMQGGSDEVASAASSGNDNYEGYIFEDCVFASGPAETAAGMRLNMNAATTPTNDGLTVRRCVFVGVGCEIQWDGNETADQNLKVTVENCVFLGYDTSTAASYGFYFNIVTSGTFASGGVTFVNNVVMGPNSCVWVDNGTSTTYPIDVSNCVLVGDLALNKASSNDGALTSDYNTIQGDYVNVTAGGNDRQETSAWLLGGLHDWPLRRFWGWSPYNPWEPMTSPGGDDWSSLVGDGNATDAPAEDMYTFPRPMGPGADNADDRGPVEARARLEPETTTVRTGDTSGRFEGAGVHRLQLPVAASSTTVSVYGRYDATYSGTLPTLKVIHIPGVADQSDVMTGAANNWEELTVTFTPTSAGVAIIELWSYDTTTGGEAFFDDLTVS